MLPPPGPVRAGDNSGSGVGSTLTCHATGNARPVAHASTMDAYRTRGEHRSLDQNIDDPPRDWANIIPDFGHFTLASRTKRNSTTRLQYAEHPQIVLQRRHRGVKSSTEQSFCRDDLLRCSS